MAIGIWMLTGFTRFRMNGRQQNEILFAFPFMIIGGVLFAFMLDALFTGNWRTWNDSTTRKFGFTYTGWLTGCLLFICIYGRFTTFGSRFLLNFFLPVFALSQAIGRVGCFLGGCCYGIPCKLGVAYPHGSLPFEIMGACQLFPVQILEAVLLLALFLLCLRKQFHVRGSVYLIGVAIIRSSCEFLRGDERGDLFGIVVVSPQQVMSMLFLIIGLLLAVENKLVSAVRSNLLAFLRGGRGGAERIRVFLRWPGRQLLAHRRHNRRTK